MGFLLFYLTVIPNSAPRKRVSRHYSPLIGHGLVYHSRPAPPVTRQCSSLIGQGISFSCLSKIQGCFTPKIPPFLRFTASTPSNTTKTKTKQHQNTHKQNIAASRIETKHTRPIRQTTIAKQRRWVGRWRSSKQRHRLLHVLS